jgi:hypothetical protein
MNLLFLRPVFINMLDVELITLKQNSDLIATVISSVPHADPDHSQEPVLIAHVMPIADDSRRRSLQKLSTTNRLMLNSCCVCKVKSRCLIIA